MLTKVATAAAVLATAGLACAHGPALRDPQARITAPRVAGLPTQVDVFIWDQGGRAFDSDLMEAVRQNVDESFTYALHQRGGRGFGSRGTSRLDHFADFYRWSGRTMKEILGELVGDTPRVHHSVADWRYPGDVSSWRAVLNADFVLVSFFHYGKRQEWSFGKRGRSMEYGIGELTGSASRAIACVVALDSGRVAWCNYIPNNSVAMEQRRPAQSAVDILLTGL